MIILFHLIALKEGKSNVILKDGLNFSFLLNRNTYKWSIQLVRIL